MPGMTRHTARWAAAGVAILLLAGCEDDTARLLSELGVPATQPSEAPTSEPFPSDIGELARDTPAGASDLLGGRRLEMVHEPDQSKVTLRLVDVRGKPTGDLDAVALWLAGPEGPEPTALEPCSPAEPGCRVARSPLLSREAPRGVLRFELDGQRHRISLRIRTTKAPATSNPQSSPESHAAIPPGAEGKP